MKIAKSFKQDVTVWAGGVRGFYGDITYPAPRTIKGRWEQRADLFIDNTGKQVVSAAVVYVGEAIAQGAYVMLGESNAVNPKAIAAAYLVRGVSRTPSINGKGELIKLWL